MTGEKHKVTDFYRQLDPLYKRLIAGFAAWQRVLNYEKTSQRDIPKTAAEFLSYIQDNGYRSLPYNRRPFTELLQITRTKAEQA